MDPMNVTESLFRWLHVAAGALWVGLLGFFVLVSVHALSALEAETRKKVLPELLPRALAFFRWAALVTWVSGVLLLGMVYYHSRAAWEGGQPAWGAASGLMVAFAFLGFGLYDVLFKVIVKPAAQLVLGYVLVVAVVLLFRHAAGFSFRGVAIHLGTLFGTIMVANVWMRIWPAQRRMLAALRKGESPDASALALAEARSRHNAYLAVPLLFTMLAQHATWASGSDWSLPAVVLVSWLGVLFLLRKAASLKTA